MKKPDASPWKPIPWEPADVSAIQALHRGDASPEQQKRVLDYIINDICDTYGLSYRPASDRDTTFAEGKRFVGLQIVAKLKFNLAAIKQAKRQASPTQETGK